MRDGYSESPVLHMLQVLLVHSQLADERFQWLYLSRHVPLQDPCAELHARQALGALLKQLLAESLGGALPVKALASLLSSLPHSEQVRHIMNMQAETRPEDFIALAVCLACQKDRSDELLPRLGSRVVSKVAGLPAEGTRVAGRQGSGFSRQSGGQTPQAAREWSRHFREFMWGLQRLVQLHTWIGHEGRKLSAALDILLPLQEGLQDLSASLPRILQGSTREEQLEQWACDCQSYQVFTSLYRHLQQHCDKVTQLHTMLMDTSHQLQWCSPFKPSAGHTTTSSKQGSSKSRGGGSSSRGSYADQQQSLGLWAMAWASIQTAFCLMIELYKLKELLGSCLESAQVVEQLFGSCPETGTQSHLYLSGHAQSARS
eukprot:gene1563-1903_t